MTMDVFNLTIIEVPIWMNDSTPQKTMNVITDLCPVSTFTNMVEL